MKRPPGYEDVHAELVIEDAINQHWPLEFLRDEGATVVIAVDRPEGYERTAAIEVAKDAVKETWPAWSLLKRGKTAGQ